MGNARNQKPDKGKKKGGVKIKYISSPMKVKASSASEFRAIVQELTGCNSSVPERMDEWSFVNGVDEDAVDFVSVNNPICPTSMLDQGFLWREASNDLPGFQFLLA